MRVNNRQGIGWTFSYQDNYLQQVTHTSGRSMQLHWTGNRLTAVTDPDGAVYSYEYDLHAFGSGDHRLTAVTLPGVPQTHVDYHYEKPGRLGALTGKSYAGVRYSTFDYDQWGRATLSEHAGGVNRHQFEYLGPDPLPPGPGLPNPPPPGGVCDPVTGVCNHPQYAPPSDISAEELQARRDSTLSSIEILQHRLQTQEVVETNPLQKQTVYTLEAGRITTIDGLASAHCAASSAVRAHDQRGYPSTLTDFNGHQTQFEYEDTGQMSEYIEALGTPQQRTTRYDWDEANHRVEAITVEGHHRRSFVYRPDHRLDSLSITNLSVHGVPNQTRTFNHQYSFHANGLLHTHVLDGPLPGDAITTLYNAQGDLIEQRNSLGHATVWSQHNGRGQPGRVRSPNQAVEEYRYDARGRVDRVRRFRNNGQQDTHLIYNTAGVLHSVQSPDGVVEVYTYDAARRLTHISRTEPGGMAIYQLVHDNASNVEHEMISRNGVISWQRWTDYDELNRVRARRGNNEQHTVYQYDSNSNLRYITRQPGAQQQVTELQYDALNRLRLQIDAMNGHTQFIRDAADRLIQLVDARGNTTSYQIDGFGQLWSQSSPDTGTLSQQWTPTGLRSQQTRADGVTVTFQHDTLGRPTQATANGEVHSFVWDSLPDNTCARGLGRLCEINDPHQHLRLSYTRYGELSRIWPRIQSQGGLLHDRHFDDMGRLQRIVYAGGVEALYNYTLNQVTSVDVRIQGQIRPLITSIEYQPMGPATRYEFGNGNNRVQAFDLDGRITGTASKTWHGMAFDYDSFGRIEQLINYRTHAWNQSYGYDALNRLTSAVSPGLGNQGFDHDAVGNRTVHIRDSQLHSHQIDPQNNRVQTISGAAPRSYSYRATGEVASILGPLREDSIHVHGFEAGNSTHFVYDAFQRLSRVHGPGVDARYRVSALGMRVEKQARGRTTRFVYTPEGQLLAEHNISNNQRSQHVYLHGRPIALVRNQQVYWTQTDHLGRPEVLIDDNGPQGQEVWRATLSAFERNVIKDQIGGYALGFPGQYHDEETSFAYNVFRDYDPRTGRYLQSDPIGLAGGVNTYGYVGGNPVSFVDPLGLIDLKIPGVSISIHANPGPNATTYRAEHGPPHVHLGGNDGPRVDTKNFRPLSEDDARKMTRAQKRMCDSLTDSQKDLIRARQRAVFSHGRYIIRAMAMPLLGADSITNACRADPVACAELIDAMGVPPGWD